MASRSAHGLSLLLLGALALAGLQGLVFVGPAGRVASRVARASFDSGKVNVGVEIEVDVPPPPQPVLECDEGCMTAIFDCIDEGCSVEALMKLDEKLAEDEARIVSSVDQLKDAQKTAYSEENAGTLAWLDNFLSRSGSLRAQLQALRGIKDVDFVQQMVKAAAVAFGGGRPNDYPKIGVASYSESPP